MSQMGLMKVAAAGSRVSRAVISASASAAVRGSLMKDEERGFEVLTEVAMLGDGRAVAAEIRF